MWGITRHCHSLQSNYEIRNPHTPTKIQSPTGVLDTAIMRKEAEPINVECVEALSTDQKSVLLLTDKETQGNTAPKLNAFTIKWDYYRQILQGILGNRTIASIEETDAAISIFTSTIKSAKNASKLYHAHPPRKEAISNLEELLGRKRIAQKNMHQFKKSIDRQQYNFLKNYIYRRLQHSRILKFEKHVEDTNATNTIWKITERFTKCHTHTRISATHGRNGPTYTPLDKAAAFADVYEDQFRPNPEQQTFENLYYQIRTALNTHLETKPKPQPPPSLQLRFSE